MRTAALSLALLALLPFGGCTRNAAVDTREPIVATTYGKIRGTQEDSVYVFRGIQYGASTAGDRRFKPPVPPDAWTGVRDATRDALLCPQELPSIDPLQTTGYQPNSKVAAEDVSEDCLYLRVTTGTLDPSAKRPVMVWIHGGGFLVGSGMYAVNDGTRLVADGNVVQVAINHRLNLFGFLQLDHLLGPEYAGSGNAGMLDIVLALQWIRDNIAQFGGDPDNVTLFGQSGGGAKISTLMAMPAAQGLYHKVIIQSGSAYPTQRTLEEARNDTQRVLAHFNLDEAQARTLLTMPLEELRTEFRRMQINMRPVVDGNALPRHPWYPDAPAISANVPIIIGVTETEGTRFVPAGDFALDEASMKARLRQQLGDHTERVVAEYRKLYPEESPTDLYFLIHTDARDLRWMMDQINLRLEQEGSAPVYAYQFQWHTPVDGGKWRSPHGVEIPFIFNTLRTAPSMVGEHDAAKQALADDISRRWIAFAHTGDPNADGLPRWDPYTTDRRRVLLFNAGSEPTEGFFDERLAIYEGVPRSGTAVASLLMEQRAAAGTTTGK
jgi:para-nitrobenzyl esterase